MTRRRFYYNPDNCRYEPYYVRGKVLLKRVLCLLILATVIASGGYYFTMKHFQSIAEIALSEENTRLKLGWAALNKRIENSRNTLDRLIEKDDKNYRLILDQSPLDATIREAGTGGSESFRPSSIADYPYIIHDYQQVLKIRYKTEIEMQSYTELEKLLDNQILSWAARPAIQPINNTQLDRLHLTYGLRLHPIDHVVREHKGLDFAAAKGTPVYASGDGRVSQVYFSDSYGKVVFIDHGFTFETRYAHLDDFAVKIGDSVKRGELIGHVGNTGKSVAPHLHYEILLNGEHVNPINFFQRNLSNAEYQKLIENKSETTISLD